MAFEWKQHEAEQRARYDWAGPLTLPIPEGATLNGVNENQPDPHTGPGVRRSVMITLAPDQSPRQAALMIWAAMAKQPGETPWNLDLEIMTATRRQGQFFITERGDLMIPRRNGGNRWSGWRLLLAAAHNWATVWSNHYEEEALAVMTRLQVAGIPCRTIPVPDPNDNPPEGESWLHVYGVQVQPPFEAKAQRIVRAYLEEILKEGEDLLDQVGE